MIPRFLGLLPFFVLGLHLKPRHLTWVLDRLPRPHRGRRTLAIGVMAAYTDAWANAALLWYDTGYADLRSQRDRLLRPGSP